MTIELDPTQLAVLTGAVLTLIAVMLGTLAMAARALRTSADANSQLSKTLIGMNDELQESIKDRRKAEDERRALQREIDTLKVQQNASALAYESLLRDHRKLRDDSEKASVQLGGELARVKGQLKIAEGKIRDLENQVQDRDLQIERLTDRIAQLEKSGKEKDTRIDELNTALTQSETDKRAMSHEIKELEARLNGKADKPTDDKQESADDAPTPERKPEPDEHSTDDKPQEA